MDRPLKTTSVDRPSSATMWNATGTTWELVSPSLAGTVDVARPWNGFSPTELNADFPFLLGAWFGGELPSGELPPVETHARGTDLIACYAEDGTHRVRPEFIWQWIQHAPQAEGGLELIASAQTSKLSSDPRLRVRSRLAASEVIHVGQRQEPRQIDLTALKASLRLRACEFLVIRPLGAGLSYAEFVHPSDFVTSELRATEEPGTMEIWHELFAPELEKGVIRRGRVRGVWLQPEQDVERARQQLEIFANSKPLLSA